jgi:hypothetical protein
MLSVSFCHFRTSHMVSRIGIDPDNGDVFEDASGADGATATVRRV